MNSIPQANQFAVIGVGRFGGALAKQLAANGKEVLAIDSDEQKVTEIADFVTHSAVADSVDEHALDQLGIRDFDVVIIGIGQNMQANILTALLCKEMGVKYVGAKAQNDQHRKVLEKIGIDMVVSPESESGHKLAGILSHPDMNELAEVVPNFKIIESDIPATWVGKNLIDLKIRQKLGISLLVVKRGDSVVTTPEAEFVFNSGDIVVICGENSQISKFSKMV